MIAWRSVVPKLCSRRDSGRTTAVRSCSGRGAFQRVREFAGKEQDAVAYVLTNMGHAHAGAPSLFLELPCLVEQLAIVRLGDGAVGSVEVKCTAINVASHACDVTPGE